MTSLVDKEYVVVSNSDADNTDNNTMTEREDGDKLDNNLNNYSSTHINESCHSTNGGTSNGNISHHPHANFIADETADTASMTSDGGHSDTATSTQLLGLDLSAIQTKW
eukprot:CAMPEP_0201571658 /NCGR_PEP_ID=MMETSP0190_2-20130828/14541_1 /ASSEMBLY_ACC=CAM_ASM_000263 /TAXON_ID=37353 /ORGANISM="Rosalina sp." /LENGTH=108 /DNA_ID=CAMNT_0047996533 /DNA_START=100 /DNA_END=423 /DNA_ORIENTATION=-